MAQDASIMESLNKSLHALSKVHYIIFVTLLLSMVGFTLVSVTTVLNTPADSKLEKELTAKRVSDNFENDTTIPRINKLEFSDSSSSITLPEGERINPFIEE